MDARTPWWRGAAIYQIYPRSFMDSNGDGIGDLAGVTSRLEYVASLGVDAIWISPFYASPMADFGYDISDYCAVDPIFGTLEDFDALVARAHELNLKVIIDQVYAHTSDKHRWFEESRTNRNNKHADWYVWADAKPDGSPPNNWQSVFGGPSWTWDARRGQYYLHNFLPQQPQLNVHLPEVQKALLDVSSFWLDRGVDGFRIDALNFTMHDPKLRDNPPAPDDGQGRSRPFDFQLQRYNQSHPDIPRFIERLREQIDHYPSIFTLAEVGGRDADHEMKLYTAGKRRLDSAYGFNFLYAEKLTPALVARSLLNWPDEPEAGWPSWAFENHDAPRALSRWSPEGAQDAIAPMKAMLLASLRGNPILYQGEELGLTQVDIPFDKLQDREAIANWPLTLSRDGVRTPMPWQADARHGGFTEGEPWLPLGEENLARAVDRLSAEPETLLKLTRRLLTLRRSRKALRQGSCEIILADDTRLVLRRSCEGENILALFNMTDTPRAWPGTVPVKGEVLAAVNGATLGTLPAWSGLWLLEGEAE